ncbi:MAG: DUF5060 domain-containing protein, partial [Chloroflexota bacterium]
MSTKKGVRRQFILGLWGVLFLGLILFMISRAGGAAELSAVSQAGIPASGSQSGTVSGAIWNPLDITFDNPSWSGNPFDLVATVTFTHQESGSQRSTEMFYNGGNQWVARFTADQSGSWSYATQSGDGDLNGKSGSISISSDAAGAKGFVVANGDKWTRSATGEAFVPQYLMAAELDRFDSDPNKLEQDLVTFIDGHGFTGFHIRGYCHWFDLGNDRCSNIASGDRDPSLETFAVVEAIIFETYKRGGSTHIWMYGDNSRKQNPTDWGLNGTEDQRVQRYLAARLGALPGWSLGYGYDISEWASPQQINSWYNNIDGRMMYPHLMSARGNKNVIMQHTEILSYAAYEQHEPDYNWYVNAINDRPTKPSFSEDRFRVDQAFAAKDYTFEQTRRGLWHAAMAGGIANIWGNMQFDEGGSYQEGSRVYPNGTEIKAYADFINPRFNAGMIRCNQLTDGNCLAASSSHFLFYKENTSAISLDLSGIPVELPYLALNTVTGQEYSGSFQAGQYTWTAPSQSDWALAIGDFCILQNHPLLNCDGGGETPQPPTAVPTTAPTSAPTTAPTTEPPQGGSCDGLVREAEAGTVNGSRFVQVEDTNASGGYYMHVPDTTGDSNTKVSDGNYIELCFTVTQPGEYRIDGTVAYDPLESKINNDSFFVQVNDAPSSGYIWDIDFGSANSDQFVVDSVKKRPGKVEVVETLSAGEQRLKFHLREDGTKLDKVALVPLNVQPPADVDLEITTVAVTMDPIPACLEPEEPIPALGLKVFIRNNGSETAGTFLVEFNGTTQAVSSLAGNAQTSVFFTSYAGGSAVTVDSANQIAETDETNNSFTQIGPVPTPPAPCPTAVPSETPIVEQCELLTNTGFENGFEGWVRSSETTISISDDADTGAAATAIDSGRLSQQVSSVAQGTTVQLSLRYKVARYGHIWAGIDYIDANGNEIGNGNGKRMPQSATYSDHVVEGIVPAGTASIDVWIWGGSNTEFVVDNVSFSVDNCVEPTPVPTTEPTPVSTIEPTAGPTLVPTTVPTVEPTLEPTEEPNGTCGILSMEAEDGVLSGSFVAIGDSNASGGEYVHTPAGTNLSPFGAHGIDLCFDV